MVLDGITTADILEVEYHGYNQYNRKEKPPIYWANKQLVSRNKTFSFLFLRS